MKVMILAGGYGTRLYALVKDKPKALLEIHNRPLIDYVMDKIASFPALEEVVVVTNDKFFQILSEWAEGYKNFKCDIRVVNDGTKTPEDRLGSIGDLNFVLKMEADLHDWVVVGSDNIFDYKLDDFIQFAMGKPGAATIGLYDVGSKESATSYGVVSVDEQKTVTSFEEKPKEPKSSLITMCLYYFPKETLRFVGEYIQSSQSADAAGGYIQWLYKKNPVYGFKFSGKWYDIGDVASYEAAREYFTESA